MILTNDGKYSLHVNVDDDVPEDWRPARNIEFFFFVIPFSFPCIDTFVLFQWHIAGQQTSMYTMDRKVM